MNCFTSVDGEALLLYAQWTDEAARAGFSANRDAGIAAVPAFGPVRYRVYRSLSPAAVARRPTSLVTATFDVDGPERQRHIADALCRAATGIPPHPAGLGSHFHLSRDGTRVLDYTEWNDDAAHDVLMDDGAFDEIYRLSTETPGVRATRGRQYTCTAV
ncbi:MAG: hypothetical protein ACRD0P_17555 [Stackebrandtia sp.]